MFDIESSGYTKIEKTDYISKMMAIPYAETVPEEKTTELSERFNSIFEDEVVSECFLRVLGLSSFIYNKI